MILWFLMTHRDLRAPYNSDLRHLVDFLLDAVNLKQVTIEDSAIYWALLHSDQEAFAKQVTTLKEYIEAGK